MRIGFMMTSLLWVLILSCQPSSKNGGEDDDVGTERSDDAAGSDSKDFIDDAELGKEGEALVLNPLYGDHTIKKCESYREIADVVKKRYHYRRRVMERPIADHLPGVTKVAFHIFTPIAEHLENKVPIFHFNGGPGFPSYYTIAMLIDEDFFEEEKRRIYIFMDQRGTGGCSDPMIIKSPFPSQLRAYFQHFGSRNIIKDAEAFRQAEGIKRWIVTGHSHGALLARRYLAMIPSLYSSVRDHPIVAILASGDPLTVNWGRRHVLSKIGNAEKISLKFSELIHELEAGLDDSHCFRGVCGRQLLGALPDFSQETIEEIAVSDHPAAIFHDLLKHQWTQNIKVEIPEQICRFSDLSPNVSEKVRLQLQYCFNDTVNSFSTTDRNFDAQIDKACKNLPFPFPEPIDYCQFIKDAALVSPSSNFGDTKKDLLTAKDMTKSIDDYGVPFTIVVGGEDVTSPPMTFLDELNELGFDGTEITSFCRDQQNSLLSQQWKREKITIHLSCADDHDSGHILSTSLPNQMEVAKKCSSLRQNL